MMIIGIIILVVGIALIFTGKNMTKYLPPNYQGEDDFKELLESMGNLFGKGGILFLVVGMLCIIGSFY